MASTQAMADDGGHSPIPAQLQSPRRRYGCQQKCSDGFRSLEEFAHGYLLGSSAGTKSVRRVGRATSGFRPAPGSDSFKLFGTDGSCVQQRLGLGNLCCGARGGNLWCGWGMGTADLDGVRVFAPDGKPIGHIHLPERCANVCFGGLRRNRLFMAASQGLYALYVNTQGAPGG